MKNLINALVACVLLAACSNTPQAEDPSRLAMLEARLEKAETRARIAELHAEQMDERQQQYADVMGEKGMAMASNENTEPEPPPEEKPAATTAGQSFQQELQGQPMVVAFNPNVGGFTTPRAGYADNNPQSIPCQGMCVKVINETEAQTDIAVFVDMEITTVFSGFQPIVDGARLAKTKDGQPIYGYISVLPYGQQMEFRMDSTGAHTITVTAFTRMNDGWLVPTRYGIYHEQFPIELSENGRKKRIRNLPRRSPIVL